MSSVPRSPSQEQVEQAQVDQQRREHFRLLVGVHLLHRPLSMLEGAGRFAGDADQDQPRRDPGAERRVACCLLSACSRYAVASPIEPSSHSTSASS